MHLITVNASKSGIHLYVASLLLNTEDAGLFCILKQGLFWADLSPFLTTGVAMPLWAQLTARCPTNIVTRKPGSLFSTFVHLPCGNSKDTDQVRHVTLGGDLDVKLQMDFISTTYLK